MPACTGVKQIVIISRLLLDCWSNADLMQFRPMNLAPIKAIFGPEMSWQDNLGNRMAIGKAAHYHITTAPDNTVRVLFEDLSEPMIALLDHFVGDRAASEECLKKGVEFADANPTLPYYQHLGEIGVRVVRRVAIDTLWHEFYMVLPKEAPAAGTTEAAAGN